MFSEYYFPPGKQVRLGGGKKPNKSPFLLRQLEKVLC